MPTDNVQTLPAPAQARHGFRQFLSTWWSVLKDAAGNWTSDRAMTWGSSLAYYTLFSLAPLILIAIALIGLVFGPDRARTGVLVEIRQTVGAETARAIETIVTNVDQGGVTAASLFGLVSLLFGASGAFVELQDALNHIWKTDTRPSGGVWAFVKQRLLSITAVIGTGFLLLVSLVVSSVLSVLGSVASGAVPGGALLWQGVNFLVSLGLITCLFALIYRLLPDAPVAWRDVWGGALLAALLFSLGKHLFGLYLSELGVTSMYASAASVVVVLLWVYYSSLILLFGAEVTHSYAALAGTHRREESH
jgi:membrane protein